MYCKRKYCVSLLVMGNPINSLGSNILCAMSARTRRNALQAYSCLRWEIEIMRWQISSSVSDFLCTHVAYLCVLYKFRWGRPTVIWFQLLQRENQNLVKCFKKNCKIAFRSSPLLYASWLKRMRWYYNSVVSFINHFADDSYRSVSIR